jgi:hypothetical protein
MNALELTPERGRELTQDMRPDRPVLAPSQLAKAVKALLADPQALLSLTHRQALEAALPKA